MIGNFPAKALTIAGSDSGGGAGIQADLKVFAALGVYGSSVITAVTAQNTQQVTAVLDIPVEMIDAQLDAVMVDIGADAAKTGMLSSSAIVETVAAGVKRHGIDLLVVDPVMVAKSGDRLLQEEAVAAVRSTLLPLAYVVTPNIPEAEVLSGRTIDTEADMVEAARAIHALGARNVVVKGGHLVGNAVDILFDGSAVQRFSTPRVATENTHGTGCSFSAAITARLAANRDIFEAIHDAKQYLYQALIHSYEIGAGHSPVHHFHALWDKEFVEALRED